MGYAREEVEEGFLIEVGGVRAVVVASVQSSYMELWFDDTQKGAPRIYSVPSDGDVDERAGDMRYALRRGEIPYCFRRAGLI